MTTATTTVATGSRRVARSPPRPVRDAVAVAGRNLIAYRRVPQLLVFSTIQPVMFVLLFRYVFGGAFQSSVPGIPYVDYLMPGIFVQTTVFGAIATAVGLATDLKSGLLERFRSLPMARSAVLAGRTLADLTRNVFVTALMAAVGFAVGFRVHTGALAFFVAMGLVLLFGYALSWVFATVGLVVGDPETAQAAAFPVLAPLVFASTVFVPASTMPSWAQLAAAVRRAPAGVGDRRGGPGAGDRRPDHLLRAAVAGVVRGHPAGVRADRGAALPPHGVTA
jgi:ABC transporter DrrB family efflux protein